MNNSVQIREIYDKYIDFLRNYRLTLKPEMKEEEKILFINRLDTEILGQILTLAQNQQINQSQTLISKLYLFTWQLLNFRVILSPSEHPIGCYNSWEYLVREVTERTIFHNSKVFNAMLICFFNLIKNDRIDLNSENVKANVVKILKVGLEIAVDENNQIFSLQWLIYFFQICNEKLETLCFELIESSNKSMSCTFKVLNFVSMLQQVSIEHRHTTQLVSGYSSKIQAIKQMYRKQENNVVQFKMNIKDYQFLIKDFLPQMFCCWKNQLREMLQMPKEKNESIDCLLAISNIINCCIFLGGYNKEIQQITCQAIMPTYLEFLEISYLIYQLFYSSPKNIKLTVKNDFILNLSKVLKVQIKNEQVKLPLQQGQLTTILRVLTNLVHINTKAQQHFQSNLAYFRIVMSLTHQADGQPTMKQWAIVFLRNVSERSEVLREELRKLQIDIKTDQEEGFM